MFLNKKAVSPLIATVLLIGFTVAIVAMIIIWGKGYIGESAEKEGATAEAKLQCQGIDFTITNIEENNNQIMLRLRNQGSIPIDSFIFRIKKEDGTADVDQKDLLLEGQIEQIIMVAPEGYSGGASTVEVIPQIKLARGTYVPCTSQSLEGRI